MQGHRYIPQPASRNRQGPIRIRWTCHFKVSIYLAVLLSYAMLPSNMNAFVLQSQGKRQASLPIGRGRISPTSLNVAKSGGKMIETVEQFNNVVLAKDSPRPILAFFSAAWCGPCRLSVPVVREIMKQYAGKIDVVEINTDDLAETSAECGVVSIPTIQFYYQGQVLDTIVGCVAKGVLSSAVTKVLEDIFTDAGNADES